MEMQPSTIRLKISDKAIKVNELLIRRKEVKDRIDESYKTLRKINEELGEILPKRLTIPSCEKCGKDLIFQDIDNQGELKVTLICEGCEEHE